MLEATITIQLAENDGLFISELGSGEKAVRGILTVVSISPKLINI